MKNSSSWLVNRLLLLAIVVGVSGCRPSPRLVTEYGKVAGQQGMSSVNGTAVFYEMVRNRAGRVKRYTKVSPRLERFETIFWFPDNYDSPSQKAIDALTTWLGNGYGRTLVYVGRDYNSDVDFLNDSLARAGQQTREEAMRMLAESKVRQDAKVRYSEKMDTGIDCDWFDHELIGRRKAIKIEGVLARGVDVESASIEISDLLVPVESPVNEPEYDITTLLEADGYDFVFSIDDIDRQGYSNRLIVVTNGSFLLNYGLVNKENRKLAGALIDQCDDLSTVVFLESGTGGIRVLSQDSINHNTWGWIAQPPLRYMVPHFLMWGILFCFVFFPIFGRPRKLKTNDNTSFRSHIVAMGKLLERSRQPDQALEQVRRYQQNAGRDPHQKND